MDSSNEEYFDAESSLHEQSNFDSFQKLPDLEKLLNIFGSKATGFLSLSRQVPSLIPLLSTPIPIKHKVIIKIVKKKKYTICKYSPAPRNRFARRTIYDKLDLEVQY